MRVLVTGGAGFTGSHLVESLVQLGCEVDVIDDLSTGNIDHLREVGKNSKLNIHFDRIENTPLLASCMKTADFVYHLVPGSNEKILKEDPALFLRKVMGKAQTIFDHAAKQKVPTLISISQNWEYQGTEKPGHRQLGIGGDPLSQFESVAEAAANAIYEYTAIACCSKRKQPIAIARLFNVTGPGQTHGIGRVIKNYLEPIMQGKNISIPKDGTNTWHFTQVGEVVAALIEVLKSGIPVTGAVHDLVRPVRVTTKELVECAIELTGSASRIQYHPARPGDIHRWRHDHAAVSIERSALEKLVLDTMEHISRNSQVWEEFRSAS